MILGLNHITLAVSNIDISFDFYSNILKFKPLVKWDKGAYFLIGDPSNCEVGSCIWFCLNLDANRVPNSCYTHYAFSVSQSNFRKISENIVAAGVTLFKENTSPGDSLYFLDPDAHKLEIHTGNVESRIIAKKADISNWQEVEWFV